MIDRTLQLFMGEEPYDSSLVQPIENRLHWCKPDGGIWTSTWDIRKGGSDWAAWCKSEGFGSGQRFATLLRAKYPKPEKETDEASIAEAMRQRTWQDKEPKLLEVCTLDDLKWVLRLWGQVDLSGWSTTSMASLDFEAIALAGYVGVHLTEEGQWATRLTTPSLYGWDCESTIWFGARYLEPLGEVPVHEIEKLLAVAM